MRCLISVSPLLLLLSTPQNVESQEEKDASKDELNEERHRPDLSLSSLEAVASRLEIPWEEAYINLSHLGREVIGGTSSLLKQAEGLTCGPECGATVLGGLGVLGLARLAMAPVSGSLARKDQGRVVTNGEMFARRLSKAIESAQERSERREKKNSAIMQRYSNAFWSNIKSAQRRNEIASQENRKTVSSWWNSMTNAMSSTLRQAQRRNEKTAEANRNAVAGYFQGVRSRLRVAQERSEQESRENLAGWRNLISGLGFNRAAERSTDTKDKKPATLLGWLMGSLLESGTVPAVEVGGRRLDTEEAVGERRLDGWEESGGGQFYNSVDNQYLESDEYPNNYVK